jgi:hypothetical protein
MRVLAVRLRVLLFPVHLARKILLAIGIDVHLDGADATAIDPRNFQPGPDVQRSYRIFQQLLRNSGVQQGAHEYISADLGKTIEVGYANKSLPFLRRGRREKNRRSHGEFLRTTNG